VVAEASRSRIDQRPKGPFSGFEDRACHRARLASKRMLAVAARGDTMPARAMIKLANRGIGILVVAIAFALSGFASALMCSSGEHIPEWTIYLVGVPFAIVSMLFFSNSPRLAIVLLVLNSAAWVAAYLSVFATAKANQYVAMCVPGFVGGFLVAVATGISRRNLLRISKIVIVALVGLVTGLSFFVNTGLESPQWRIFAAFALWQSVVGVTLYLLSAR
jgi:hypothetical protein